MTKIEFDEPSKGNVNSDESALEINQNGEGYAIMAKSKKSIGIVVEAGDPFGQAGIALHASGFGENATGIEGHADKGNGIKGTSLHYLGVYGTGAIAGVSGVSSELKGVGVKGQSDHWMGVYGESKSYQGVHGESKENAGVVGHTIAGWGVYGVSDNGVGVYGEGPIAGHFKGDVEVTGDIKLINADCAEDFDILEENVGPGTVMVLTENGSLRPSNQEYDKKVVGIVSGSRGYKPAIILDRQKESKDRNGNGKDRLPIALIGKVYCRVDARNASIEIGDLLTTSSTMGSAMKAVDPKRAFGAVIGKALSPIRDGQGLIPILVSLQ
jgi:hypothetical protein